MKFGRWAIIGATLFAGCCNPVLAAWTSFQASTAPPASPAAVVCNFVTGVATGVGAGTCVSSLPTCNGTADDTASFQAFTTWAIGWQNTPHTGQIELFVPSGTTCTILNDGIIPLDGITNFLYSGYGSQLTIANGVHLGTSGQYADNMHSTRLVSANAGDTTITVNPASASQPAACNSNSTCTALFTVGKYAMMGGIDLQDAIGFPINPFRFEYVLPTNINSSTGVITLASPLQFAYKSTWPNYSNGTGGGIDYGGPATLFAVNPSWNATFEFDGVTINIVVATNGEFDADTMSITFKDVTMNPNGGSPGCATPSSSMTITYNNVQGPACALEPDKLVQTFNVTNGSNFGSIAFQSGGAFNTINISNSTLSALDGTPLNTTITNSTIGTLTPGAGGNSAGFGRSDTLTVTNSTVNQIGSQSNGTIGGSVYGGTGNVGLDTIYTMSGGIITIPDSYATANEGSVGSFTPDGNVCFGNDLNACAIIFQITDITHSGSNTLVHTSLSGGFPAIPGTGYLRVRTHPMPVVKFTNVTGTSGEAAMLSDGAAFGLPIYSYGRHTYANSTTGVAAPYWAMFGTLTTMAVNVTGAYGGASAATVIPGPLSAAYLSTSLSTVIYSPTIDLKTPGNRTLSNSGGYPASWAGTGGADSAPNLTQPLWSGTTWHDVATDLSGDHVNSVAFTVTETTNPGLVYVP